MVLRRDARHADPALSQIALITVEGVLAAGEDLRSASPTKWAKPLYDAVRSQFRTIALTRSEQEIARWWLRREALPDWTAVLCWNSALLSYEEWKLDVVRDFLANAWDIAFLLDPDRDVTTMAQSMGVLTFTLGHPLHHPGWKPENHQFKTWQEVTSTVDVRP